MTRWTTVALCVYMTVAESASVYFQMPKLKDVGVRRTEMTNLEKVSYAFDVVDQN